MKTITQYTYHIDPRPDNVGGGWRLRLIEDDREVGGGIYPITPDMTSNEAYLEASDYAEHWLQSRDLGNDEANQVQATATTPTDDQSTAMLGAMCILVGQLRRAFHSIQESPRLADVRSLASLGLARIDALMADQRAGDYWTSPATLPDADTTVLLALSDRDVWPGYYDGAAWRASEGFVLEAYRVIAWMHIPASPLAWPVQTHAQGAEQLNRSDVTAIKALTVDRFRASYGRYSHPRYSSAYLHLARGCFKNLIASDIERAADRMVELLQASRVLGRIARQVTPAAQAVLDERARQVDQEEFDLESDDGYVNGEIAAYAAFYAMPPAVRDWPATETGYGATFGEAIVPADWMPPKPGDRRCELVKAGALVLAEIERIDRAARTSASQCAEQRTD